MPGSSPPSRTSEPSSLAGLFQGRKGPSSPACRWPVHRRSGDRSAGTSFPGLRDPRSRRRFSRPRGVGRRRDLVPFRRSSFPDSRRGWSGCARRFLGRQVWPDLLVTNLQGRRASSRRGDRYPQLLLADSSNSFPTPCPPLQVDDLQNAASGSSGRKRQSPLQLPCRNVQERRRITVSCCPVPRPGGSVPKEPSKTARIFGKAHPAAGLPKGLQSGDVLSRTP